MNMDTKFVSTDIYLKHNGFGWYGEVLMAKKTNMLQQAIIGASGTGCVKDGEWNMNIKLSTGTFPEGFNHEEYDIIAWRGKDENNHLIT